MASVPFPVYVVPGNHDVPTLLPTERSIGLKDFPYYYRKCGYENPEQLYYSCELLPGVQLIALNSNQFDDRSQQLGCVDDRQLAWLEEVLREAEDRLVLVMIHHNVVEHLPGQSRHELGKRYMLDNASSLLQVLRKYRVKLIFSGHLHVQDVADGGGIYEITTGSLVSFPHPYRVLNLRTDARGKMQLTIESYRVEGVPGWENLLHHSRKWMGDRSYLFMMRLLTGHPLYLPIPEAERLVPHLRYFWADIAAGDPSFDFPEFPDGVRRYFRQFSAIADDGTPAFIDNWTTLLL